MSPAIGILPDNYVAAIDALKVLDAENSPRLPPAPANGSGCAGSRD